MWSEMAGKRSALLDEEVLNRRLTLRKVSLELVRWLSGKSNGCSSRELGFNSLDPHGSSQVSVTPVPGDSTLRPLRGH